MDAKNQQDRAKMVEEAVGRMCRLGMMPQVITKFRKQGTVLKSETVGILYDLNDEENKLNAVLDLADAYVEYEYEERKKSEKVRWGKDGSRESTGAVFAADVQREMENSD